MQDTITIRTCDDPPVALEASRAVLAANSKVFADMLAIPTQAETSTGIDIDETAAHFKPFLRILNMSHEEGDPLDDLEPEDWPVVAKLADKYDSAVAKNFALAKCWKWNSSDDDDDKGDPPARAAAFQTAAILGEPHLAKVFLFEVLENPSKSEIDLALRGRRAEFTVWVELLKDLVLKMSVADPPNTPDCAVCKSGGARHSYELAWRRAMSETLRSWRPYCVAEPFGASAALAVALSDMCRKCKWAFKRMSASSSEEYRNEAPDFPL
ncbi:hypothetical protein JCM3775_003694 [Rhodotorula graminis]